jgi:hypothetical protein
MTGKVRLQGEGLDPVDAQIESATLSQRGKAVSGFVLEPVALGASKRFVALRFHLLNLPYYVGELLRDSRTSVVWHGRQRLASPPFSITLDEIGADAFETKLFGPYFERPRVSDGYLITHVGEIRREDDSLFSLGDVRQLLTELELFLAFVRGAPSPLILSAGVDSKGEICWKHWDAAKVGRYQASRTWCASETQDWGEAFRGLRRLVTISTWGGALPRIIGWYADALAQPRHDGTLVVAQVALEALAWVYCVGHRGLVSEKGFDGLAASDKFRMMLGALDLKLDLGTPDTYRIEGRAVRDGPELVTSVRNLLVHGSKTQPAPELLTYAKELALTYIELSLLRLFGYSGLYRNRFEAENADTWVPWSTRGSGKYTWTPPSEDGPSESES